MPTVAFAYTGGSQAWQVPAGVTAVTVDLYGAQGGPVVPGNEGKRGGYGGRCQGTISVTPGETLQIVVGGAGGSPAGGFNGGGSGHNGGLSGGGGGGGTDVRRGGTALANRTAVAGGGGGAGGPNGYIGGAGGGLDGGLGSPNTGEPGTQAYNPNNGADLGLGGSAGTDNRGGGGGGFYGGGVYRVLDGASASGAGGSSLVPAGGSTTTGARSGDGYAVLTYNTPPSAPGAPSVSPSPVNTTGTVSFTAGTDPDGDALVYDTELSRDGVTNWIRIRSDSASLSFTHDFSAIAATSTAKLRTRSNDGQGGTSDWTVGPVFTIQHNRPPTAPTITVPAAVNRNQPITVGVGFNDPDPGDSPGAARIRYGIGAARTGEIYLAQPVSTLTIPAGLPAGVYEIEGQSTDAAGEVGPWSETKTFTAVDPPPGIVILSPSNGATIPAEEQLVQLSSTGLERYQYRVLADLAGIPDEATVIVPTVTVLDPTSRKFLLTGLPNNTALHIQARQQVDGLYQEQWTSIAATVAYTPPAVAEVFTSPVRTDPVNRPWDDAVELAITNPAPAGGQPAVTYHRIWRRVGDSGDGIRIANGHPAGQPFVDDRMAFGIAYSWRVESVAGNGTVSTSDWTPATTTDAFDPSVFDPAVFG